MRDIELIREEHKRTYPKTMSVQDSLKKTPVIGSIESRRARGWVGLGDRSTCGLTFFFLLKLFF
jgi:hypothetical protein